MADSFFTIMISISCINYYSSLSLTADPPDPVSYTDPPDPVSCNCIGNRKCDKSNHCTLKSAKHWCYTIIRNFAGVIAYERGCVTRCTEYYNDHEMKNCCQGDKCNNEAIPSTWPSVSSTMPSVVPTKSYVPPSLTEATTATPASPTTDDSSTDILIFEQPTTSDPENPRQLICHCSGCRNGLTTCVASVACASLTIDLVKMTWCVQDKFSCKNSTFELNCCYTNYCNGPPMPSPGSPCDDEDTEQSGGCEVGELLISEMHWFFM